MLLFSFDKFMLCGANDLSKRSTVFVTFLCCSRNLNRFFKRGEIPCQIEMPFQEVAHRGVRKIISRLYLIFERRSRMSNLRNCWVTFTFLGSLITTHIRLIHHECAPRQTLRLMKNVWESDVNKKCFFFEENNYIIEARQTVKYFVSCFDKCTASRAGLDFPMHNWKRRAQQRRRFFWNFKLNFEPKSMHQDTTVKVN
jgi:hypothetical protein